MAFAAGRISVVYGTRPSQDRRVAAADLAIDVRDLRRSFRRRKKPLAGAGWLRSALRGFEAVEALAGVTFQVARGEVVAYVGPNGSGKSTTIKCLTGILVPSSGHVECLGMVPWRQRLEYTARIGVLFGQKSLLFWDLPVRDAIEVYRRIYGVGGDRFRNWLEQFDALFGLGKLLDRRVYTLSLGERMRCEVAASFLHRPSVLFLDEPTIGLDAQAKDAVRQLLSELHRSEGLTVLLTTHQMEEVETLATRLVVLAAGRVAFDGSPGELRARYLPVKRARITFSAVRDAERLGQALAGCRVLERGYDMLQLEIPSGHEIARLTAWLLEALEVIDLEISDPPMDQVMLAVYGGVP